MFSLIIAIVSIALIVALVALSGYFGGDAISAGQARSQATRLINEESQILAAMDVFQADNKRWPTNLEELISGNYLRSIPTGAQMQPAQVSSYSFELVSSAHAADIAPVLGWSMPAANTPIIYTTKVLKAVCQAYNLASRGDDGILRQAFEALPAQCYGADGDYRVVVKKAAANVTLAGVLDSSVEAGALPAKEMPEWWDAAPAGPVKVPTDPSKTPKAELALTGAVPISFGQVQLGKTTTSGAVTLTNRGKVVAQSVALDVPQGFGLVNSTCGTALAAGAACSFSLDFAPTVASSFSGSLKVNVGNGASVQTTVSGEGVGASAVLGSLNFGNVPAGVLVTQDAVLLNNGIDSIRLGGASASGTGFAVTSNGCPATLAAGASCTIKVGLTPVGVSAHSGTLSVAVAELGTLTSPLSGQSQEARLSVSPATVDAGDVQTAASGTSATLHVVSNTGNLPVTGLALTPPADFALANSTCTTTLNAGSTCSFNVKFSPTQVKTYTGTNVAITSTSGVSTKVDVSGKGWAPSGSVSAVDFGTQNTGTTADLASTVTNTGKGPLTLKAPTVTGTNYSLQSTTCTTTLAAGATCTVTVRFTAPATAGGPYAGTVNVDTNGATSVLTNSLTASAAPVVSFNYSLGAPGAGGSYSGQGSVGGNTSATVKGISMLAYGGAPGSVNSTSTAAGGTAAGGSNNVTGGKGSGINAVNGNTGGGGGGGIGAAVTPTVANNIGASGAQAVNVSGLQAAVTAAGYNWTGPGAGGPSVATGDNAHGAAATGFGSGGGGAGVFGGNGGAGLYGGGGGGAAGNGAASNIGGAGGSGAIVVQFADSTAVVLTSGSSYTVPAGKTLKYVWLIGGGGGGGASTAVSASSGGGGAGGVVYQSF